MERWEDLASLGFPGYEVSNQGMVRNERSGRILKTSANQDGVYRVGLMNNEQNRQITLSLPRLVAIKFVPGRSTQFNTPINLNGDRSDNTADNLLWRPRWFAVKYVNQFDESEDPLFRTQVLDVETSREYLDSREASSTNGLLEEDIMKSVVNGSPCFPTWQIFARASH